MCDTCQRLAKAVDSTRTKINEAKKDKTKAIDSDMERTLKAMFFETAEEALEGVVADGSRKVS